MISKKSMKKAALLGMRSRSEEFIQRIIDVLETVAEHELQCV